LKFYEFEDKISFGMGSENKNGIIHFSPNVIIGPNYFNMFQKRYQDKIFIFKKILRNVGSRTTSGMSLYRSTNM